MKTLMNNVLQKDETKEFMAQHPVHAAVCKAFEKHFENGFTLKDLPFLTFTGDSKEERTAKQAA